MFSLPVFGIRVATIGPVRDAGLERWSVGDGKSRLKLEPGYYGDDIVFYPKGFARFLFPPPKAL